MDVLFDFGRFDGPIPRLSALDVGVTTIISSAALFCDPRGSPEPPTPLDSVVSGEISLVLLRFRRSRRSLAALLTEEMKAGFSV